VRVLLEKWPTACSDGAFTVATMLGHAKVAQQLAGLSKFVWCGFSLAVLLRLGAGRARAVLSKHRITEGEVGLLAGSEYSRFVLGRRFASRGLLETRELAESYVRTVGLDGVWGNGLARLGRMGLRASQALPRGDNWDVRRAVRLLGPCATWDVDAFVRFRPSVWWVLVEEGAPLTWSRHADGTECLPILERQMEDWVVGRFFQALRGKEISPARHHYCDGGPGCGCGRGGHAPNARALQLAGATPCSQDMARVSLRRQRGAGLGSDWLGG
jgi:hypothetical protein